MLIAEVFGVPIWLVIVLIPWLLVGVRRMYLRGAARAEEMYARAYVRPHPVHEVTRICDWVDQESLKSLALAHDVRATDRAGETTRGAELKFPGFRTWRERKSAPANLPDDHSSLLSQVLGALYSKQLLNTHLGAIAAPLPTEIAVADREREGSALRRPGADRQVLGRPSRRAHYG